MFRTHNFTDGVILRSPETSVYLILNALEEEHRSSFAKVWVLGWGRWHDSGTEGGREEGRHSEALGDSDGKRLCWPEPKFCNNKLICLAFLYLSFWTAFLIFPQATTQTYTPPHQGLKSHLDLLKSGLHWEERRSSNQTNSSIDNNYRLLTKYIN